jgi:hypothetical protein
MIKLTRTGIGTADVSEAVRDSRGSGLLPIQADGDGATTFKINGRVAPDAPWVEIKAAGVADFLENISWLPYLQLEVTAGAGTVTVWIGEG